MNGLGSVSLVSSGVAMTLAHFLQLPLLLVLCGTASSASVAAVGV